MAEFGALRIAAVRGAHSWTASTLTETSQCIWRLTRSLVARLHSRLGPRPLNIASTPAWVRLAAFGSLGSAQSSQLAEHRRDGSSKKPLPQTPSSSSALLSMPWPSIPIMLNGLYAAREDRASIAVSQPAPTSFTGCKRAYLARL